MDGRLLSGVKSFCRNANACVDERFRIYGGVRRGCVMSPWQFHLFIDRVVREMKAYGEVELCMDSSKWKLNTVRTVMPKDSRVHCGRFSL